MAAQSQSSSNGIVRNATPSDLPTIIELMHELTACEYGAKAPKCIATREKMHDVLFGSDPKAFCLVSVEYASQNITGVALWHAAFSSWHGQLGIYLEDVFVSPKYRGLGHGKALLAHLAKICVERGYPRMQWWMVGENKRTKEFYESLGAVPMADCLPFRLDGEALAKLAEYVGHSSSTADRAV